MIRLRNRRLHSLFQFATAGLIAFVSAHATSDTGRASPFPQFDSQNGRAYVHAVVSNFQSESKMDTDACLILARVHSQLGQKSEAELLARQALKADPNRPDAQSFLAGLLILEDKLDEAAELLRQAVALRPTLSGAQRQLGMVLDRLGDREGASKAFLAAIEHAPADATARLLLGRLLLDHGDVAKALPYLERACELQPDSANAFYLLAQAQLASGSSAAAAQSLDRFRDLKGKEKAQLDTKNFSYDDGKYMQAVAAGLHIEAGKFFLQKGQPAMAEPHLRQAHSLDLQGAAPRELLFGLLVQSERLAEAQHVGEELVRLFPKEPKYHINLGTVFVQLNEPAKAASEWKQALELDPVQTDALRNMARLYLSRQQELRAALTLARRLAQAQPNAASYDLLGWALFANGERSQACAAAARAVELDPTNAAYRLRYQKLMQKAP